MPTQRKTISVLYTGSQKELLTRGADGTNFINQYYTKTAKKIQQKSF